MSPKGGIASLTFGRDTVDVGAGQQGTLLANSGAAAGLLPPAGDPASNQGPKPCLEPPRDRVAEFANSVSRGTESLIDSPSAVFQKTPSLIRAWVRGVAPTQLFF